MISIISDITANAPILNEGHFLDLVLAKTSKLVLNNVTSVQEGSHDCTFGHDWHFVSTWCIIL